MKPKKRRSAREIARKWRRKLVDEYWREALSYKKESDIQIAIVGAIKEDRRQRRGKRK